MIENISLLLQALSLQILFQDYNNVDLMHELYKQDKEYLETIIKNQEKILKILEEGSESQWKNN